jgi:hypothetical protein
MLECGSVCINSAIGRYPGGGLRTFSVGTSTMYRRLTGDAFGVLVLGDLLRTFEREALGRSPLIVLAMPSPDGIEWLADSAEHVYTYGNCIRFGLTDIGLVKNRLTLGRREPTVGCSRRYKLRP